MQTIVAFKVAALEKIRSAKAKRAAKSTKAHSRRWLAQEYSVELSSAIEAEVNGLERDERIIKGACRFDDQAIAGSALRGGRLDSKGCHSRVEPHDHTSCAVSSAT